MSKNEFPFNSLSCTQTPLHWPRDAKLTDIPEYKTSDIRILGTTAGPGRLLQRSGRDGQTIEENPQITMIFEKQTFNVTDVVLHFPGMHKIPGFDKPPAGEIHVYFRNSKRRQIRDNLCLVIPIRHGSGKGSNYFEFLNRDAQMRTEFLPSLTSILTDKTPALLYKGKDLKNRGCGLFNPESQCLPESYAIQYIVLQTSVFIRPKDVERLRQANPSTEMEVPSDPVQPTDLLRFCAYYKSPGLRIGSTNVAPSDLPNGVVRMDSLKCRSIDTRKDIKGDKIIIDPKARLIHLPSTIEGQGQGQDESAPSVSNTTGYDIQPGDFEEVIALPLGLTIGSFLAGGLFVGAIFLCYKR
jgi:hypothetical protein